MNIIVACEESQEVCKAFRARGHTAFSCDLQECSGGYPEWHIINDIFNVIEPGTYKAGEEIYTCFIEIQTQDGKTHIIDKWDMIIAHPPCTYLTKVSATSLFNENGTIKDYNRIKKMFEARDFFMRIYNNPCKRIAIENPTPLRISALPEAQCVIQPWEHGEPYTKRTLLWLKGLPPIVPSNIYYGETISYTKYTNGSKTRSKTFPGVAKAMAEQWG